MSDKKFPMGYTRIPALMQIALVFERLSQIRWDRIFGLKSRKAGV